MSLTPTPTSLLEAVNYLLELIEESPVNDLVDVTDPDVAAALRLLDIVDRELQSQGWDFNTETEFTLSRDISNQIPAPGNVIRLSIPGERIAIRDGRLFDRTNQTFTFDDDLEGVIVQRLAFEDLPETARNYLVMEAGMRFFTGRGGDELGFRLSRATVESAWAQFVREDTNAGGYSLSTISAIQNRSR